jgi:membrane protein implicated in regulation of membrane protease activity
MLRPIFMIGLFALAGLFLLKLFFGVFGGLLGLVLGLLFLALKIAIVGAIVYVIIRIVSPETARRLRERFSGPSL